MKAILAGALAALAAGAAGPAAGTGPAAVCAEVPTLNDRCPEWASAYDHPQGHAGRGRDLFSDLAVSPDGARVFAAGRSEGEGTGDDLTVVAVEPGTGATLWEGRYDGGAGVDDAALAVAASPDGARVYAAGRVGVGGDGSDLAVLAFDPGAGARMWVASEDAGGDDAARSVAGSPDGSRVYVTGESDGAIITLAYAAGSGARLWSAHVPGRSDDDGGVSVRVAPDGSRVYVTGENRGDYLTVAYEADDPRRLGEQLWAARYHGGHGRDTPAALAMTRDGERLFVTGGSEDMPSLLGARTRVFATTAYDPSSGAMAWVRRYAVVPDANSGARTLAVAPDGTRVYVAGRVRMSNRSSAFATVAYEAATGTQLWGAHHSTPGYEWAVATSLAVSPDGARLYVGGQSGAGSRHDSDDYRLHPGGLAVVAYDVAGSALWAARHDPVPAQAAPWSGPDQVLAVAPTGTAVYIAGSVYHPADLEAPTTETGENEADWRVLAYRA